MNNMSNTTTLKKINFFFILFSFLISGYLKAQVVIGSVELEDFSSLQLDTVTGLRLSQINDTNDIKITDVVKAEGLIIYDKKEKSLQFWNGTEWVLITGADDSFVPTPPPYYLLATGKDTIPCWTKLNISEIENGSYYLYSSFVDTDTVGLAFSDQKDVYPLYMENENLVQYGSESTLWVPIQNLNVLVDVPEVKGAPANMTKNKLTIQFQTTAQIPIHRNNEMNFAAFGVGIFVGNWQAHKLRLVRSERIEDNDRLNAVKTYTLTGTIYDLPVGQHEIIVAINQRAGKDFVIGRAIGPTDTNASTSMTKSYFNVDLYVVNYDPDEI